MIFADASALIAILAQEDDARPLFDELKRTDRRFYSAVSQWETTAGLSRSYKVEPKIAAEALATFLERMMFEIVPIGVDEARLAFEARYRYGRGRHPAALNMGDCFAYACAKSRGARLLYKGNDFNLTDLA